MDENLKTALIIVIILIILMVLIIGIVLKIQKNNVYNALKEVFKTSDIEKARNPYDYKAVRNGETYFIKYLTIPKASAISINYQYTWQLYFGGNVEKKGQAFPKTRMLNEMIPFCKDKINEHEHKVCVLYKSTEHVDKYLNEHEMAPVHIIEKKYGYYIVQYDSLVDDMNVVFDDIEKEL